MTDLTQPPLNLLVWLQGGDHTDRTVEAARKEAWALLAERNLLKAENYALRKAGDDLDDCDCCYGREPTDGRCHASDRWWALRHAHTDGAMSVTEIRKDCK